MNPEDVGKGSERPETELAATQESGSSLVKLRVTNVYTANSSSKDLDLDTTATIWELKILLQKSFDSQPAPQEQRLIFRGKLCEEEHQLGHILRGVDLAARHIFHLVAQPSQQPSAAEMPRGLRRVPYPSREEECRARPAAAFTFTATRPVEATGTPPTPAEAPRYPQRLELDEVQMAQLRWQYQQALKEQEHSLHQQQARYDFLAKQFMSLGKHSVQESTPSDPTPLEMQSLCPVWSNVSSTCPADGNEVATSVATRALGGDMPGPAAGGAVRDITNGAPVMIDAAGLDEDGRPVRGNLVDPPPDAPPALVNWGRLFLKLCVVVAVFAVDAQVWQLILLAIGAGIVFLFKTGLLASMLGAHREGGGVWKFLCSNISIIDEDGGILVDSFYLFTSLVLSVFPQWKPRRSPQAIAAAAAAAQELERDTQAQAREAFAEMREAEIRALTQQEANTQMQLTPDTMHQRLAEGRERAAGQPGTSSATEGSERAVPAPNAEQQRREDLD